MTSITTPNSHFRWLLLSAICMMAFVTNADYLAVNFALIPMANDFHTNLSVIQWILSGYMLSWAAFVIPAGSLLDKYNNKYLCIIGIGIFLLASLLAGISQSALMVITARVLQGVGGAVFLPTIYAMIYKNFSKNERGRAMGFIGLSVGIGLALGPVIGGLLIAWVNWQSIFFLNIPIGVIAILIITRSESPVNQSVQTTSAHRHDPLSLLKNKAFLGCCVGIFLVEYAFSTVVITMGLYLHNVLHLSSLTSSTIFLFMTIIFGVIAAMGGPWIDRIGLRIPTIVGLCILAVASILFVSFSDQAGLALISFIFMLMGAGLGLSFTGLNTGIVKTTSQNEVGIASSIFLMITLIGNAMGVSISTFIHHASIENGALYAMTVNFILCCIAIGSCVWLFREVKSNFLKTCHAVR